MRNSNNYEYLNTSIFFEDWRRGELGDDISDVKIINLISTLLHNERLLPGMIIIQDYRRLEYSYFSRNSNHYLGKDYSCFENKPIDLALEFIHPDDLIQILSVQKEVLNLVKKTPLEARSNYSISFVARIFNQEKKIYTPMLNTIRPLIIDNQGNVLVDYAFWRETIPFYDFKKDVFWWEYKYKMKDEIIVINS